VGVLTLHNCTFATNTAIGGIGGNTSIGSLTFPGSGGNAEGVALYNTGQLVIFSCTIASNTATGSQNKRLRDQDEFQEIHRPAMGLVGRRFALRKKVSD